MNDEFYTPNHMSSSSCAPIKIGFGFSFIDFLLFLIVLFFMYCPIGVSSQVVVSGNEGCGYGYGCPFMVQQQQQQQQQMCISEDEEEKKDVEKTHEERLQILTKENQLLAYELEQAKLKYSIQKLVSETRKLSVAVSDAETDTEIEM